MRPAPVCCSNDGDPGSWPDLQPRLLSGRTTPTTCRAPGSRGSIIAGALAAITPSSSGSAAADLPVKHPALTPEISTNSSMAGSGATRSSSCSSSAAASRRQSAGGAALSVLEPAAASSPTVVAQEQLLRMQEAWRESVEKDVICLREVLGQYKEQVERLEMQKKLLLSQVRLTQRLFARLLLVT